MIFTSPLLVPMRRRPEISPCRTSRSCSIITVSLVGENRSMRWNVERGAPVSRSSTTRSRSSSTGRNSERAVYTSCWVVSSGRISYCHTAQPRSWPRKWNTNESRVAGTAARSKRSDWEPEPWAADAAGLASSRKQSQRIGLENGLLVRVAQGQREELIDVHAHVLHPRTRPVRAPHDPVGELRETRKVLQQACGRNPGDVEPHSGMTAQHEERLFHIQRPAAVGHHDRQVGKVDRDVVELERVAVLGARAREDARAGVDHHGQAALLATPVDG